MLAIVEDEQRCRRGPAPERASRRGRIYGLEVLRLLRVLRGLPVDQDLDPAVVAELQAEHNQMDEDLQLLDWLLENTPDSPDILALTDSLAERITRHLARDSRLLARAARLAQ